VLFEASAFYSLPESAALTFDIHYNLTAGLKFNLDTRSPENNYFQGEIPGE
jgi:hypothetical protein